MTLDELWLVRHGESVGNVAATRAERDGLERIPIDLADAEVPLSSTGREQADALRTWWQEVGPSVAGVWVSPYLRARQTSELALGGDVVRASIDERLRDRELGVLDLLTRRGVEALHPEEEERRKRLGKYFYRPPGGESWADVTLRLRSFLRDAADTSARRALVVAHDAVVMLLVGLLLGWDEREVREFAAAHTVLNASVTHLRRTGDRWELIAFSDVSHLERRDVDVTAHPGRSEHVSN